MEEERGGLRNRSDPQDTHECGLQEAETAGFFRREAIEEEDTGSSISNLNGTIDS